MSPSNILIGGIPPYIYGDIGGADRWVWFVSGDSIVLESIDDQLTAFFIGPCKLTQSRWCMSFRGLPV
jgi:hypothetical protein